MDQKSKLPSYEVGGVKGGWSEITTVLDEDGKLIPEIEDALWGLWGLRAISYQQVDRIINEIGLVVQNSKDGNVDWESAPTLNMAFDEYSSRLRGLEKIKEWSVEKLRQLHTRLLESQKGALEMHSKAEEALRKTIARFITRFHYIEESLKKKNKTLNTASLSEMEKLWSKV